MNETTASPLGNVITATLLRPARTPPVLVACIRARREASSCYSEAASSR